MTCNVASTLPRCSPIAGAVIIGVLLAAAPATAQEVLFAGNEVRANPLLPESKGIKLGDGRLHPFGELDAHYVYNPGRLSSAAYDAVGEPATSRRNDAYFVLRPGADYKLPSPHLDISANAYVERQQYIHNTNFSSFQGGLGGNLIFNKDGPLQLRASQRLTRTAAPGNQTYLARFNHWTNTTSVGVDFEPGGGALKLSGDLSFFADLYDSGSQVAPQVLDNERYTPSVRGSWSFLPKTQLFAELTATRADYRPGEGVLNNADSWLYSGFLGLNGVVTNKVTALLKLGYSGITTGRVSQLDRQGNTVGIQAEATWAATVTSKLRLGGAHQLEPVSVFIYAQLWKGYLRFDQAIATRLNVSVGAEYYHLSYAREVAATNGSTDDGSAQRHDDNVQTSIAVAYYLTEFVTLSLVDRLDVRGTNYQYVQVAGQPDLPAGYRTHDLFFRAGIRY